MSFPAYPSYQDSGVDWIGWVPSGWAVEPLKAAYAIVGGATPKSEVADYWDGDVPWVTPGDLSKLTTLFIGETIRTITEEGLAACAASRVPSGSVILSTRAPIGSIGITTEPTTTNQGCKALVPRRGANSSFLAYTLSAATTALNVRGKGTTFLELSGDELGRFNVPTPSIVDQATIAAFLDRETARIDALIEEQQRLIELLKEKRQAVISHAVTKGLDPTAPTKDSGVEWLGEVPAHWDVRPLKYLINLQSGGTPRKDRLDYWDGSIPWVSAKDLKSDNLVDSQDHISEAAIAGSSASLMPAGSVLVLVRGMMLARSFPVCRALVPMAINQDLKAIEGKAGVSNHFLAWLLRGTAQETLNRLDEAGHGTKALRMDAWVSMLMPVPPENEQVAIALTVDKRTEQIDALIDETASAKALLQERRSALITNAVTGKIDVRGVVESSQKPEPELA